MHISTIEITSKKVCGNHADFSTTEIKSKKVRGNHVDLSTIEITSKKVLGNHVEIRRNLVFDVSTQYPRRIDVDSTWCARWVHCRCSLLLTQQHFFSKSNQKHSKG